MMSAVERILLQNSAGLDCRASVMNFSWSLGWALPYVCFGVGWWAAMLGNSLPEGVEHGKEAWRAASGSARLL
jgi:hypothetical protein